MKEYLKITESYGNSGNITVKLSKIESETKPCNYSETDELSDRYYSFFDNIENAKKYMEDELVEEYYYIEKL